MMILALDPSSKKVGWCVAEEKPFQVIEAGASVPPGKTRDERILGVAGVVLGVLSKPIDRVVIETPPACAYKHGQTLLAYGMAVGAAIGVVAVQMRLPLPDLAMVTTWIGGRKKDRKSKRARQVEAKALWPAYDPSADKGGDISDAICLAHWYVGELNRRSIQEKAKGAAR